MKRIVLSNFNTILKNKFCCSLNLNSKILIQNICLFNYCFQSKYSSKKFSNISSNKNVMDYIKEDILEKPKLFKLTFMGLESMTTTEEVKKVLSLINEITVLNVDKKNKKNYCHVNLKSYLNEEILKDKMNKLKITGKAVKVRVKEIDTWIDNVDKKKLEPVLGELKSISEINEFINKELNRKQMSSRPENIRYLNSFLEYFEKEKQSNPTLLIQNLSEKNFLINFSPNYVEFEWLINHLNEKDLIKNQFKEIKLGDLKEKNYFINEIKTFTFLEKGIKSDKLNDNTKSYYNQITYLKEECRRSLDDLIKNLKFPPFYDNNQLIWKGMKLQILHEDSKYICNICISIEVNLLSLLDISIIKKALLFKFKKIFDCTNLEGNAFLCISKGINSQINESTKFININDIVDYDELNKYIRNNINDNSKSEHEYAKKFIKMNKSKILTNCNKLNPYNSVDSVIEYVKSYDFKKIKMFRNSFHYIGNLIPSTVFKKNNELQYKSGLKVNIMNVEESKFIEHANILENLENYKIIEKSPLLHKIMSNKSMNNQNNILKGQKIEETEFFKNCSLEELEVKESLLIINLTELNKNKNHQIQVKKLMQNVKHQLLYCNSIKELIDFCKFYSNRNIDFKVIDFHLIESLYLNFNSFILLIELLKNYDDQNLNDNEEYDKEIDKDKHGD